MWQINTSLLVCMVFLFTCTSNSTSKRSLKYHVYCMYNALIQTLKRCDDSDQYVFCCFFLSWGDMHSAYRDLQSERSPSSLHDCWLNDVAQPFHYWDDLPISCGQWVHTYTCHVSGLVHLYMSWSFCLNQSGLWGLPDSKLVKSVM